MTARIFLTPFKHSGDEGLKGLGFGLAGILDNEVNQDNIPWQKLESSFGGNAFMTYGGSVVARGDFYHWDAQGYYYNGPFGFLGEYVQSIQSVGVPGKPAVQLTNIGWLAEASFVLGGEAGYEGVKVDQPFDLARGQLGGLRAGGPCAQQLDRRGFLHGGLPLRSGGRQFGPRGPSGDRLWPGGQLVARQPFQMDDRR